MSFKMMSRVAVGAMILATAFGAGVFRMRMAGSGASVTASGHTSPTIRGEYLVRAMGCNDCHTPMKMGPEGPEPDMSRSLSGHPEEFALPAPPALSGSTWAWAGAATNTAFTGPWGTSYAMNLTPDTNTGLGIWTEDMFLRAIKTGRHMGQSRPIMPPMPWPAFRNLRDEDLKAVFAYLRTIRPVTNHVPDYTPPEAVTSAAARH